MLSKLQNYKFAGGKLFTLDMFLILNGGISYLAFYPSLSTT
jgi:hypothetical protein